MRKIIKLLALVAAIACAMSGRAFAYTEDQADILKQMVYDEYGVTLNAYYTNEIMTQWENHPDNYLYAGNDGASYIIFICVPASDRLLSNGNVQVYSGDPSLNLYTPSPGNTYWNNSRATFNLTNGCNFGTYDDVMYPIDYDVYGYDPSIAVPAISAVYADVSQAASASDYSVPVDFVITNNDARWYYVELKYRYWAPNNIKIVYGNGTVSYNNLSYSKSNVVYKYAREDEYVIAKYGGSSPNYIHFDASNDQNAVNAWTSFKSALQVGFTSNVADSTDAQTLYDTYSKNAVTMGNRVEVWCRFFVIDESDNAIRVGPWMHWSNAASLENSLETGNAFVSGSDVPSNVETQTEDQGQYSEISNVPPINISNNINLVYTPIDNVPNSMNYPTISAYQSDNLLVDMMNQATNVTDWLNGTGQFAQAGMEGASNGGFGAFLGATFGWIPWYVWSVIAIGFGLSIIIMIIKVL